MTVTTPKSTSKKPSETHFDAMLPANALAAETVPAVRVRRPCTWPLRRCAIPPARVEKKTWLATIAATLLQELIDHARAGYPNEACGLLIGDGPAAAGGVALRFEATRNKAASPYRYEIDPDDLYRLTVAADDADEIFWGIVHSHTHTPAVPSPTDVGLAFYPDALYVLVSLAEDEADRGTGTPSVRAWRIVDGAVHEVALDVTAG